MRVPYALAFHGKEEEDAVLEVLREHKTVMGPKIVNFEAEVALLFGKKYGIMVNSGSSANLVALKILNLPPGSEVITPALTFATVVAPILQCHLKPVFLDVVKGNYQIDIDKIEEKITSNTKALMIPSLVGNIPDLRKIREICDKHNLIFIEDSCDTIGGTFEGMPTGSFSHVSTTSFYGSHIITAAGGGGMVCVNTKEHMERSKVIRGWGRSSAVDETEDLDKRFGTMIGDIQYDSKFVFSEPGYNFLPLEISAAFGLAQLKKLPAFTKRRNENFANLLFFFQRYEKYFILPKQLPQVMTNWIAFPLTIRKEAPFNRREITTYLEENDIQTRPIMAGNILRQPGFKSAEFPPEGFPNSDEVMGGGFFVGCHQGLSEEQLIYLKQKFTDFILEKSNVKSEGDHSQMEMGMQTQDRDPSQMQMQTPNYLNPQN